MLARIFTEPQQGATYDQILAMARATEDGGFDAFFRSDHVMAFTGDGQPGPTDAWTTLAALSRETSRIRLGTLVTPVTFRPPGLLSIIVAQVDAMSGGRVELGLGTGWHDGEHAAYGLPFPPLKARFGMLTEQLEIVTGLWDAAAPFSYAGEHYTLRDSPALPKPVQRPRPPIILGGAGARRTPALAARFADEFNVPFHTVEDTAAQFQRVRAACEAIGRDPATMILSVAQTVVCGETEGSYQRRAEAIGRTPADARKHGAGGTPGEVVENLRRFGEAGAQRMYMQLLDLTDTDHVGLLADEVRPHL